MYLDLRGIKAKEIVYNPDYEVLFNDETNEDLGIYEKAQISELDAVNVMTGIYTGRSPKDKYIVMDERSKDTIGGIVMSIQMIIIL